MRKLALILSPVLLAACSTYDPVTPAPVVVAPATPVVVSASGQPVVTAPVGTVAVAPAAAGSTAGAPVVVPTAVRAGNGRIESITTVASAAAGTTGSQAKSVHRIAIRMEDGTVQVLDTPASGLQIGDRVELTRDGMIRH